jgi:pimeloyl-ACP methyl ester carboxylesterase
LARPPVQAVGSVVLVHGAGTGPWVFDGWADTFARAKAVDLQDGLDPANASMADYAARIVDGARRLPPPVALVGWSMGGLVVLEAVAKVRPAAVVLLEASPPAEVQGLHPAITPASGAFDPEEVYPFPPGIRSRPESKLARTERHRGISAPSLPCRSLVVYGHEFPEDRGRRLAALYGSEELEFPDLDHFGLVLDRRVREAVARFLLPPGA